MPWGVKCPHGDPVIPDALAECGKPITFPKGWHEDAVDGTGLPLCHWFQSIWDGYSPQRQEEVKQRVSLVEQYLR